MHASRSLLSSMRGLALSSASTGASSSGNVASSSRSAASSFSTSASVSAKQRKPVQLNKPVQAAPAQASPRTRSEWRRMGVEAGTGCNKRLCVPMHILTMVTSTLTACLARAPRPDGPSYPFSSDVRTFSTPPTAPASSSAVLPPAPVTNKPSLGIMAYAAHQLRAQWDPRTSLTRLFARRSPAAIPVGSVLSVETWLSPAKSSSTTFSGVLMAVRRRGTSTSFVLRNLVQKLGVEVRFNLYSPLLKEVTVLAKANGSKRDRAGKIMRTRRAKLYYLRNDQKRIMAVGRILKARKNAGAGARA